MLSQKSVLARLLANENISVEQANFPTAFFDVESRTLGLPLWKQMSADVYDLLVGHEVGHALYSPATAEALKIKGVPFSYMNVIEDIRIEKAILVKYPGLVANFKRGYLEMMELDIFSTKGRDINKMFFMDRLNIKAKVRDAIDVQFSAEEMPYVKMAMAVETFEDVANVGRAIVAWLGAKNDPSDTPESGSDATVEIASFDPDSDTKDSDDQSKEDTSQGPEGQPADPAESEADEGEGEGDADEGDDGEDADEGDDGEDADDKEGGSAGGAPGAEDSADEPADEGKTATGKKGAPGTSPSVPADLPEVETEIAQRQNMASLTESSAKTYVQGMTRQAFELLKNPYEVILQSREAHMKRFAGITGTGYSDCFVEAAKGYDDFMAQTKQVVNMMAKEFEMRKAAFRSVRARTSTKGSLDVNKLHAYKYDDQLFKQVTTLADGKNHGMLMLVDYSGSMSKVMPSVIRQTIALVLFCKRVNIPFEVYGFTTRSGDNNIHESVTKASSRYTRFNYDDLLLNQLFTNKMPKRDFDRALRTFYIQSKTISIMPKLERLQGTPLNAALLASEFLIKDFMKSNPVHKMNLITLTDGESNTASSIAGVDSYVARNMVMDIKGKRVELKTSQSAGADTTEAILKAIKGNSVTATNFFICSRSEFRREMYRTTGSDYKSQQEIKNSMSRDGVWVSNDVNGYDRRFVIVDSSDTMSGENDDFEIADTATASQIAKAFSKYSGSKRGNRVVTQKFAEIIA
jgi:ACT domain-containing protein